MKLTLPLTIKVFYEGTSKDAPYISYNPEFRVASAGKTPAHAKKMLKEALWGFFETCEDIGTLKEILEEGGFIMKNKRVEPEEAEIEEVEIPVPALK